MRPSHARSWFSRLPGAMSGLALIAMLLALAACAPFGVSPPPPRPALATATAQAVGSAQANQTPVTLPSNVSVIVDAGWVAVVQVPDGEKLGGPSVLEQPDGGSIASGTMTLGHFKLSSAAQVAIIYGCTSPANVIATLEVGVEGSSSKVSCTPSGASMNRFQTSFTASEVGRTLTVTATITTDGPTPKWYALVEQPR